MSNQVLPVDASSVAPPRRTVLVVTEDEALARACRETLPPEGYDVTAASHSGHALLECLQGHRADLLLTELSMPEGSGRALATRLRRYFPEIRTLYVARPGLAHGAADVLVRPFSSRELLARVRACVSPSPAS
jgi:DNA-binding response OmpR family regulator